jgi:hypothetical protein
LLALASSPRRYKVGVLCANLAPATFAAMSGTSASEVIAIAFQHLTPVEQEEAYAKIKELRLRRLAGTDGEIGRYINAIAAVQERVDGELSCEDYREWSPKLRKDGLDVPPFSELRRYFGSWSRAKSAFLMADDETPMKIDARFRARRVGKVHRYRDSVLKETIERAADYVGHPPLLTEFEAWRQRELELAKARGEDVCIPSSSAYRNRHRTWEKALLHFGFSQEDIDGVYEAVESEATERLNKLRAQGRVVYLAGSQRNGA